MVVSNPTVFETIWVSGACSRCEQAGFEVSYCELKDGERYKTRESVAQIQDLATGQFVRALVYTGSFGWWGNR